MSYAEIIRQERVRDVRADLARFLQLPPTPQNERNKVELMAELLYLENEGVEDTREDRAGTDERSNNKQSIIKRYEKEVRDGRWDVAFENPVRQGHRRGERTGEAKEDEPARRGPEPSYPSADGSEECCKFLGVGSGYARFQEPVFFSGQSGGSGSFRPHFSRNRF